MFRDSWHRITSFGRFLYGRGLFFLIPYVVIYLLAWRTNIPVAVVNNVFDLFHLANAILFSIAFSSLLFSKRSVEPVFWIVLFVVFLIPGAYLEYPSDAWEHVRRIFSWTGVDVIDGHELQKKMGYFLAWTLMDEIEIASRRTALDFISAGTQLLVCYQINSLARRLGFHGRWAYLQVVGFIILFGTDIFNFRYYALSSTPIAFAAYLRSIVVLLDFYEQRKRSAILEIGFLLILMYFNHFQEIVFFILSAAVLTAAHYFQQLTPAGRKKVLSLIIGVVGISFGLGLWVVQYYPEIYAGVGLGKINSVGSFNPFAPKIRILGTLGVHGIVALMFSLVLLRSQFKLSLLTLAPLFCLLFPPTVMLLSWGFSTKQFYSGITIYRLLYAMPTSLVLVAGIKEGVEWFRLRCAPKFAPEVVFIFCFLVILGLSFNPAAPWRGRLRFQFHLPASERTLLAQDETAQWFLINRRLAPECVLLGDAPTVFAIDAHLGRKLVINRRAPSTFRGKVTTESDLIGVINHSPTPICGLLIPQLEDVPQTPVSWVASMSKHWKGEVAEIGWFFDRQFEEQAENLTKHGWKVTEVPPYYLYYEREG